MCFEAQNFVQDMFDSGDWLNSSYGQMIDDLTIGIRQLLSKNPSTSVAEFWDKADIVLKIERSHY